MMISVIMAIYKEPLDWIENSVNSILNQTFKNFEFIIIVDNPNNLKLRDYLKNISLKDSRVLVHHNEKNLGLTKSLNVGLELAQGKYIARMDADDISRSTRFQKQIDLMEKCQELVACGTAIQKFGKTEGIVYYESNPDVISRHFTCPNPFMAPLAHPTAFIRRSVLSENKIKYNESYKTGQDYALWSELLFLGNITNLNEVLLDYRTSDNQITAMKRFDQLSVVNNVVNNHIIKWLRNNNIEIFSDLTPYFIKDIRQKYLPNEKERFDSFIFGLLLNQKYDWKYVLKYLVKDFNFKIPLTCKLKLIKSKLRFSVG